MQLQQEVFHNDESCVNQNVVEIQEYFEINDLKARLQDTDKTICKLKATIKSLRENTKEENVNPYKCDLEPINKELENSVANLLSENERLCNEINHVKQVFKDQVDSIKRTRVRHKEQNDSLINKLNLKYLENEDLKAQIQDKVFVITSLKNNLQKLKVKEIVENVVHVPSATTIAPGMFKLDLEPLPPMLLQNRKVHITYLRNTQEQANILREIVEQAKAKQPLDSKLDLACNAKKVTVKPMNNVKKVRFAEPLTSSSNIKQVVQIVLWYLDSSCLKHMTGNRSQLMNFLGNVIILRVYYVEGLGHNLLSVGQFCDVDLDVAFWENTCFIQNLEDVDLLLGSRDKNLYTISLDDMLKSSPICLLSKATKTNFGTLNKLAKDGLARGIPRLKFQKDHLCSACALGKSIKSSHQPKAEDTNQEKLYLLHMDLCGPMRVASFNRKRGKLRKLLKTDYGDDLRLLQRTI
ncbi:hypothetical protein Tco_0425253 [Tanacetum coccineum]